MPQAEPPADVYFRGTSLAPTAEGRCRSEDSDACNAAIHVAAITQARDPGPGRDHYRRKIAEYKSVKEARRSLKRRISNAIYRRVLADHHRTQRAAA